MIAIEVVENAKDQHDPIEHGTLSFPAVPRVGESIYLRKPDIFLKVVEVDHSPLEYDGDQKWSARITLYCEPQAE